MIKLTDQKGKPIYFPVDIAFRAKGNVTEIKWNGMLFNVKETHEEVTQKVLDYRDKTRLKKVVKEF